MNFSKPSIIHSESPDGVHIHRGAGLDYMAVARAELGIREVPGTKSNPRILEYHRFTTLQARSDEVDWCSAFCNFVLESVGIPGTRSALARSWLRWGVRIETPVPGCIVILKRGSESWQGHVGFLVELSGRDRLQVLGGNQGKRVSIATFKRADVLGYRLPPSA